MDREVAFWQSVVNRDTKAIIFLRRLWLKNGGCARSGTLPTSYSKWTLLVTSKYKTIPILLSDVAALISLPFYHQSSSCHRPRNRTPFTQSLSHYMSPILFVYTRFVAFNERPPEFRFSGRIYDSGFGFCAGDISERAEKWRVSAPLSIRAPSAVCQLNGVQPRSAAVFLLICFFRFRLVTYGFRARLWPTYPQHCEHRRCGNFINNIIVPANYGRTYFGFKLKSFFPRTHTSTLLLERYVHFEPQRLRVIFALLSQLLCPN